MNERLLENLLITDEAREYILSELQGMEIRNDEEIAIIQSGTFNSEGEIIYNVLLDNGDMQRFVCYI